MIYANLRFEIDLFGWIPRGKFRIGRNLNKKGKNILLLLTAVS